MSNVQITKQQIKMTSANYENKNHEVNVVCSDFGEEIDDEVALYCAMMTSSDSTWYVVCVPGASSPKSEDACQEIRKRMLRVQELFPCFENVTRPSRKDWKMQWSNDQNATFIVGPPSIITDKQTSNNDNNIDTIDNFIRIAPLWHISPEYFNNFPPIKNYIVMGDLQNPNQSINLTKAIPEDNEELIYQYHAQEAIIATKVNTTLSIPTSLARKVAMPYELLMKLPRCLKTPLLQTAFDQCVGRVPAHFGFANNISVVNHNTILNYCSQEVKADIIKNNGKLVIPSKVTQQIKCQVQKFLIKAPLKDQDDEGYIKRLEDIAMAIYVITGGVQYYPNDNFTTFNKDNLEDAETAQEKWEMEIAFNNSKLTPCYDLLAIIVKTKGKVPSAEECCDLVDSMTLVL